MTRLLASLLAVWVVSWDVAERIDIPCPQPAPKYNEYTGRMEQPSAVNAIACSETVERHMMKPFETELAARLFMKNTPENTWNREFSNWKIEEKK